MNYKFLSDFKRNSTTIDFIQLNNYKIISCRKKSSHLNQSTDFSSNDLANMEEDIKEDKLKEAGSRIKNLVILNAWRQQREKNNLLEADVKNLTNQVG